MHELLSTKDINRKPHANRCTRLLMHDIAVCSKLREPW